MMVRKLDDGDFRSRRIILEPDDFALSDGDQDPPPTDLIPEKTWNGIMTLPGDVAIRTTSYQGDRIALLYELRSGWLREIPRNCILAEAMMDSADDFAAAIFNLLHGFYKQAISSLRNALEVMALASACQIGNDAKKWTAWQNGGEVRFSRECEVLRSLLPYCLLEGKLNDSIGQTVFPTSNESSRVTWARNLYQRLSMFSHARGGSSNSSLWASNGPIYSADGMRVTYHSYLETYSLVLLLAKATMSDLNMPQEAKVLFTPDSCEQFMDSEFQELCLSYHSHLFLS